MHDARYRTRLAASGRSAKVAHTESRTRPCGRCRHRAPRTHGGSSNAQHHRHTPHARRENTAQAVAAEPLQCSRPQVPARLRISISLTCATRSTPASKKTTSAARGRFSKRAHASTWPASWRLSRLATLMTRGIETLAAMLLSYPARGRLATSVSSMRATRMNGHEMHKKARRFSRGDAESRRRGRTADGQDKPGMALKYPADRSKRRDGEFRKNLLRVSAPPRETFSFRLLPSPLCRLD